MHFFTRFSITFLAEITKLYFKIGRVSFLKSDYSLTVEEAILYTDILSRFLEQLAKLYPKIRRFITLIWNNFRRFYWSKPFKKLDTFHEALLSRGDIFKLFRNILNFSEILRITLMLPLTHFSPIFHFYTPWKVQRTSGFLTCSGGIEMEHWVKIN